MYQGYTIKREVAYGSLFVVRYNGVKIGTAQTEAAAKMIRRHHHNKH